MFTGRVLFANTRGLNKEESAKSFRNVLKRYRNPSFKRRPVSRHVTSISFIMCRNIKTLFNFDPPATTDEVNASSLQFVRKLSGMNKPSKANEEAFYLAVERVAAAAQEMLNSMVTTAPPRDREIEAAKAKERAAVR